MLLLLFLLGLYVLFIAYCIYVWNKAGDSVVSQNCQSGLSVVICARNEGDKIGRLLSDIFQQTYPAGEVIVVDDGSTDNTVQVVESFPFVQLLKTPGIGKKRALKHAIDNATLQNIVCVDADCRVSPLWLASIARAFDNDPSLIIAPVRMLSDKSLWQRLQALEFMSLAAITAGSALMGMPVMCNGANLAFKREVWLAAFSDIHLDEPSGDDMFFLISCKKRHLPIQYLKSRDAIVEIEPNYTAREFFRQRKRWVSKGRAYTDLAIIMVALLTFILALLPLLLVVLTFWKAALICWSVKTVADGCLLSSFSPFFNTKVTFGLVALLALVYPFYVGYVGLSGFLGRVQWK